MLDVEDRRVVWAIRLGFAFLVLALWYFTAAQLGATFFASPTGIVRSAIRLVQNGELLLYVKPTAIVLVAGLGLGLIVGIPVGLAVGRWRRLYWLTEGPTLLFYATPIAAVIPVLLVILGFGVSTRVFIVFVFVVLSVIINCAAGVRNVDADLLELARSYGSSERALWREILIASSLPFVFAGVRIGVGRALVGAVVAEFYAGIDGLGYLIVYYSNRFDVATALVPVLLLIVVGVGSTVLLKGLQRRMMPWASAEEK